MPTVNIYYNEPEQASRLFGLKADLQKFIAKELSSKEKQLTPKEVSIRLIGVKGDGMLGAVEIEIAAASFPDRVLRQDDVCRKVATHVKEKDAAFSNV